ncbi:hypothetical protein INP83_17735 [Mucilaginibacter sp. 21P]|uniref:hypothetical protein n=1 Tax=Mucilaginibacter sp. 21P TaxID=2778902 RepID=UPI001C57EEEA|nr:hypothetical protein [Mucilaginibacter sp. 21P]QXV64903.1 hypothetical protein INP83_17735 [Mucilaginibacter sp. 21P]
MNKFLIALLSLFISSIAYSQQQPAGSFHAPRKIEQTIGEKYVLLPADSSKMNYNFYLHKWVDGEELKATPATDAGRIMVLSDIVEDTHAKFEAEWGVLYYQYFKPGDDGTMSFFAPAADYEKAKSFVNKQVWLKSDKKKVTVTDVKLTPDNNAPFKFTYKYANGKQGIIALALSGTNSKKDKVQLFDEKFSFVTP